MSHLLYTHHYPRSHTQGLTHLVSQSVTQPELSNSFTLYTESHDHDHILSSITSQIQCPHPLEYPLSHHSCLSVTEAAPTPTSLLGIVTELLPRVNAVSCCCAQRPQLRHVPSEVSCCQGPVGLSPVWDIQPVASQQTLWAPVYSVWSHGACPGLPLTYSNCPSAWSWAGPMRWALGTT